jgi:adenylate cyclase
MARLAVSFSQDDPFALSLGGSQIALLGGDYDEGLRHIGRALTLDANSARAWELLGWVSTSIGEHRRSVDCFQQAMRFSPPDRLSALPHAGIAWPYFFMGRYDEAIAHADKACLEMPNSALALRPKLASAAMAGRAEDVRRASHRLRAIIGDLVIERLMRIDVSRSQAQRDVVEAALRRAGVAG